MSKPSCLSSCKLSCTCWSIFLLALLASCCSPRAESRVLLLVRKARRRQRRQWAETDRSEGMSSAQIAPADHVCYVHCNFCNTVLAVSVPGNSMLNIVTVRCGHCTNLLSVNLRTLMHSLPEQDQLQENIKVHGINGTLHDQCGHLELGSSSSKFRLPMMYSSQNDHLLQEQTLNNARPPEKRQRVPSAYNRFIKEEIRRIKANNPDISHREAFSTAAKNWAHYPNIHFGLNSGREGGKKLVDEAVAAAPASKKIHGFY